MFGGVRRKGLPVVVWKRHFHYASTDCLGRNIPGNRGGLLCADAPEKIHNELT
jgi:hypothetical protein